MCRDQVRGFNGVVTKGSSSAYILVCLGSLSIMAELVEKSSGAGVVVRREPWYKNPTLVWILKSTAVNLILPFVNGVMLGFGEILANELVFKFGWFGFSRISPSTALGLSPGVPPSATTEYRKTLQNDVKRAEQQQQQQYTSTPDQLEIQ